MTKVFLSTILLLLLSLLSSESKAEKFIVDDSDTQAEVKPNSDGPFQKSAEVVGNAEKLLEQGYESYDYGNLQESENFLKEVLEAFGGSYGEQPNFELPEPGGVRQTRFNIPGIFNYESTRNVPSEITTLDGRNPYPTEPLPLDQLFAYAVYRIAGHSRGYQLSDFQTEVHGRFGGCLRSNAQSYSCSTFSSNYSQELERIFSDAGISPPSLPGFSSPELTQGRLDYASRSSSNRNIHSILRSTLDLLQRSLVAQGSQDKYEEALLFSEMNRNIDFSRIAPAVLYSSLNYETLSGNRSYSELFNRVPSYDLDIRTAKRAAERQNATIVYYSTVAVNSENQLFIWVIQPSGDIEFRSVNIAGLGGTLRQLVRDTSKASSSFVDRGQQGRALVQAVRDLRSPESGQQTGLEGRFLVEESVQTSRLRSLHDVLIEPVSDLLPTDPNSHVIFVPHRELMSTPFAALKDAEGQHLIEKHTIRVSHSLRSLRNSIRPMTEMPTGSEFVAVGNPDSPTNITYTADNSPVMFSDLSAADSEVLEISPNDGYLFRRGFATNERINRHLEDAKIIHFATHGLLNFTNRREFLFVQLLEDDKNQSFYIPQTSSNIQWNSDSDFEYRLWYDRSIESRNWQAVYAKMDLPGAIILADGPLTTEGVLSLDLEADLVVLSACNTGRGVPTESSILGLPLAFGLAGVPRTVVSQWAVPDQSTRVLMIAFYEAMERNIDETGIANPAGALREAMLSTKNIQGYSDPIFWAGFTMMNVSY